MPFQSRGAKRRMSCKVGSLMKMVDDPGIPYLRSVALQGVHPFGSEVTFLFDRRVNVLIGPNGVGKSAALDRFAAEGRRRFSPSTDESEVHVERIMEPESASFQDVRTVYVGSTRAPLTPEMVLSDLQFLDVQGKVTAWLTRARWVLFAAAVLVLAYWAVAVAANTFFDPDGQWLELGTLNLLVPYVVFTGACSLYLLVPLFRRSPRLLSFLTRNWLLSAALTYRSQVSPIFMFQAVLAANRRWLGSEGDLDADRRSRAANEAASLALDCAKKIAPEVFPATASLGTGTIMSFARILWWGWWRSFTDRLSTVHTRFSSTPLHITSLSAGTQNTLLVAWYLALTLAYSNEFREGWKDLPAILFIDEIENHLHPAWQRRFIPVFLEHFPNLQIIATTHSPFPIAGLKVGQVHKLRQGDDGITRVETNEHEIVGLTADEILHGYLDVQDPTDLETAQAVEVLRWLEGLEPLVEDESAESWRKEVVDELSALAHSDELTFDETLVMHWLSGAINSPVAVAPPLSGEAEAWRESMIDEFRSLVGVDILSGGPAARQRQIWEEQMVSGTFPESNNIPGDEHSEV